MKVSPRIKSFTVSVILVFGLALASFVEAANPDDATWLVYDKSYRAYFLLHVDMKTTRVGSAYIAGGNAWAGRRYTGHTPRFAVNLLGGQFTVSKKGEIPFMKGNFNNARDEITGKFLDSDGNSKGSFTAVLKGHTYFSMDLYQICGGDRWGGMIIGGRNDLVCINRGQNQRCDYGGSRSSRTYFSRQSCLDELANVSGSSEPEEAEESRQVSSSQTDNPLERDALIAIYKASGGEGWRNNEGWLGNAAHCDWYGVTCVNGRVTELDLSQNELTGGVSSALSDLYRLKVLSLSGNRLSGGFPRSIQWLDRLETLNLSRNSFTGVLPNWLGEVATLRWISISDNSFSGSLPDSLGELTNLRVLYASDNSFEGTLPIWADKIYNLSLARNQLSGAIDTDLAQRLLDSHQYQYNFSGNDFSCPMPAGVADIFAQKGEFCVTGRKSDSYTGQLTASYENDQIAFVASFVSGNRVGGYRRWYENGNLRIDANYESGKLVGVAHYYRQDGSLEQEASYLDGSRHGFQNKYDRDGAVSSTDCYIRGRKKPSADCDALTLVHDQGVGSVAPAISQPAKSSVTDGESETLPVSPQKPPAQPASSKLTAGDTPSEATDAARVERQLSETVRQLNSGKRMYNDQYTLTEVSLDTQEGRLIYEFDVKTSISDLNEPLLTTVAKSVYCSAEKLKIFRDNNIPAVWMYTDRSASSIIIRTETYDCE